MAKHIKEIPDCPKCGEEMTGLYRNLPPFDDEHPFGSAREGWWYCPKCGYETERMDHNPYDDTRETIEKIRTASNDRDLLEQIAEEAAELGKAALKLIRAKKLSESVTDTSGKDAQMNMMEEISDVINCLVVGGFIDRSDRIEDLMNESKIERWKSRVNQNLTT